MPTLTRKLLRLTSLVLVVTSTLAACSPASITASPTSPTYQFASSTATFTHTPLPSLTFTPTPTATPSLTPTPTYLPITPALQGTSVPSSSGVISAANADRLTLLARWGLGNPNDILYTPDGQYLIAACATGVYFFDSLNYSLLRQIDTPYIPQHLAVSPDSQLLAVAAPGQVYLYQTSDFQLLNTFPTQANSLDFSPDGQVLAIGIDAITKGYLQLRQVPNGDILQVLESGTGIWAVRFAPQGDFIASGGYTTKVWSLDGTLTTEQGPYINGRETSSISFSPDGSLLAEGVRTEIHISRLLENGRLTHVRQINLTNVHSGTVENVAISPDGSMLAAVLSTGTYAWNLETGYRVFSAESESTSNFASLAWSADSRHLAAASTGFGVQVWDVRNLTAIASLHSYSGTYTSLSWSPDGQELAVGADEGWTYLINTQRGDPLKRFGSGHVLTSLAFSADGQTLALGYIGNGVELWTMDGAFTSLEGYFPYGPRDVRFSSDGQYLSAIGSEDRQGEQTSVWNTRDWSISSIFSVGALPDYRISGFELAPDLQTAAISIVDQTGSNDQYLIRIVTFPEGEPVTILEPYTQAYIENTAYSPSGDMLAALINYHAGAKLLEVWSTSDWQHPYIFVVRPERARSGRAFNLKDSLAWSPDGSLLAVGASDGSLQVFDTANGELLVTLPGHRMWATGVAFSPDGRILASCSLDGTIMLWGAR
jgi:WD40 repeat protein